MTADTRKLTLLNLGNMEYGVWEDEILSIKNVRAIHWLPPVPEYIAGMSIIDTGVVTLFDLPACIGLPPVNKDKSSYFVLFTEQEEKKAGFIVDGIINKIPIPPDAVFPIPDYLKTPIIESCAICESKPIPIVNISTLYSLVQKTDYVPYKSDLLSLKTRQEDCSDKSIRVFECSNETFAVFSDFIDTGPAKPGLVSQLSLTPVYVKGMAFHNKSVLPLIHMPQLLNLSSDKSQETMLVAKIKGNDFGFLVDSDIGKLNSIIYSLKPLPPVAQSCSIRKAAVYQKKIIPLIDLDVLLSGQSDNFADNPADNINNSSLSGKYTGDSAFHSEFAAKDVDVVEFSLLGTRHALPESEVEDSFNFKPFRYIPNLKPIIAGVAEHNGELLPVLDLAVCFQRESIAAPGWQMILIKNGNFRAMVLTDTVFGPRRLSVKLQRDLPFEVPHALVYGCYPDESSVRLLFNTQALAVHFDSQMFRKLFSSLEKEMSQEFEDIVPVIPPYLDTLKISETKKTKEEISKTHKVGNDIETEELAESIDSDESIETSGEFSDISAGFDSADKHEESDVLKRTVLSEDTVDDLSSEEKEENNGETDEYLKIKQPENIIGTEEFEKIFVSGESVTFIEVEKSEDIEFGLELTECEELIDVMSDAQGLETLQNKDSEKKNGESETIESVSFSQEENEVALVDSVLFLERKEEIKLLEYNKTDSHLIETTFKDELTGAEEKSKAFKAGETEETKIESPVEISQQPYSSESGQTVLSTIEISQNHPESTASEKPERRLLRKVLALSFLSLLLLSILFFLGVFGIGSIRIESKKLIDAFVVRKPVQRRVQTPKPPTPKTSWPSPPDSAIYSVRKGDTLYSITERYTGDGWNYPRIARENKIHNPDLIFPDQKIKVPK